MLALYLSMVDCPEEKHKVRELYEQYHNLMMYVAMQILDTQEDAEDAVHQSFLSIIINLDKISEVRCQKTKRYCVVIVRNTCFDMLRIKKREELKDDLEGVSSEYAIDDISMYIENSLLTQALNKINERYRTVLYLKYVEGFSANEIAKALGITPDNAQKLLSRARTELSKAYKENTVDN